jgi:hypothetical protein
MQEFLHRATAAKIDRLSGRISECFRFLRRKQTLVVRILIERSEAPDTETKSKAT